MAHPNPGLVTMMDLTTAAGPGNSAAIVGAWLVVADEVLAVLGDQRTEKQIWKCQDRTDQC